MRGEAPRGGGTAIATIPASSTGNVSLPAEGEEVGRTGNKQAKWRRGEAARGRGREGCSKCWKSMGGKG